MYTLMQITKFPHPHLVAGGWYLIVLVDSYPNQSKHFIATSFHLLRRYLNWRRNWKKKRFHLHPVLLKSLPPQRVRVGNWSCMPPLMFQVVLTPRLPFNARLLLPPPLLEVLPPLLLPFYPYPRCRSSFCP